MVYHFKQQLELAQSTIADLIDDISDEIIETVGDVQSSWSITRKQLQYSKHQLSQANQAVQREAGSMSLQAHLGALEAEKRLHYLIEAFDDATCTEQAKLDHSKLQMLLTKLETKDYLSEVKHDATKIMAEGKQVLYDTAIKTSDRIKLLTLKLTAIVRH